MTKMVKFSPNLGILHSKTKYTEQ